MINIIEDKEAWNASLLNVESYDFYHTYEYHQCLKKENEFPILIKYIEDDKLIIIPFLKRKINSEYYDVTSVHGYAGPVSCNIDSTFNNSEFLKELTELLRFEKIVCVYSKLNPYINHQEKIISSHISITETSGEIIYFNQQLDDESQLKQYNRNTRQKIKQLKKISCIESINNHNDYQEFINLYHTSMKRLSANTRFYFDDSYFQTLLNSNMFDAKMIVAKHHETNDIMAGVFCISSGDIAHIELAFTNELYFKQSPVRILFEACRKLYKNHTIKYLNLGGGAGGRAGSLMKFKSTFSESIISYSVWKFIILPKIYDALQNKNQINQNSSYFPKYRLELTN